MSNVSNDSIVNTKVNSNNCNNIYDEVNRLIKHGQVFITMNIMSLLCRALNYFLQNPKGVVNCTFYA